MNRLREFVDPTQWEKHVNSAEGLAMQDRFEKASWKDPHSWVPFPLAAGYILGSTLVNDYEKKPPMISSGRGLKNIDNKITKATFMLKNTKRTAIAQKKALKIMKKKKKNKGTTRLASRTLTVQKGRKNNKIIGKKSGPKSLSFAPPLTSYLVDRQMGPGYSFRMGTKPGSMVVSVRQRLGTISKSGTLRTYTGTNATQTGMVINYDAKVSGTSLSDTCLVFGPDIAAYWTDPLQRMAENFNLFKFRKVSLSFFTQTATSVGGRLILAYTKDPDYMEAQGVTTGSGSVPIASQIAWQEADLVRIPNCVSHTVYQNWNYNVPIETKEPQFYVRNAVDDGDLFEFSVEGATASNRQSFQGILYIAGTSAAPVGTNFGDLYINTEIELWDMGAVSINALPTLREDLEKMGLLGKRKKPDGGFRSYATDVKTAVWPSVGVDINPPSRSINQEVDGPTILPLVDIKTPSGGAPSVTISDVSSDAIFQVVNVPDNELIIGINNPLAVRTPDGQPIYVSTTNEHPVQVTGVTTTAVPIDSNTDGNPIFVRSYTPLQVIGLQGDDNNAVYVLPPPALKAKDFVPDEEEQKRVFADFEKAETVLVEALARLNVQKEASLRRSKSECSTPTFVVV